MNDQQKKLVRCARDGDVAGVQGALSRGARVDGLGPEGATALHLASEGSHLDMVRLLLHHTHHADTKSMRKGDQGGTALHLAAEGGHTAVMEALLTAKVDPEARDDKGRSAVHWAAYSGQVNALEVLQHHGCNLHLRDHYQDTPLHLAAAHGDLNVVKWMIQAGSDVSARNVSNKTPRDVAKEGGFKDIQQHLKNQASPSKKSRPISPWRGSTGYTSTRSKSSINSEEELHVDKTPVPADQERDGGRLTPVKSKIMKETAIVQTLTSSPKSGRHRIQADVTREGQGQGQIQSQSQGEIQGQVEDDASSDLRRQLSGTQEQLEYFRQKYSHTQDRDRDLHSQVHTKDEAIKDLKDQLQVHSHRLKEYQLTFTAYKEQLKDRDHQLDTNKQTVEGLRGEMQRMATQIQKLEDEQGRRVVSSAASPVDRTSKTALKLQEDQQERIKQLELKQEYNKKIIDDMNEEIDQMDLQIKNHEISIASYQSTLKGKERDVEELASTEQSLRRELETLAKSLEGERARFTEAQGQLGKMDSLEDRELSNEKTITALRRQLKEEEAARKLQVTTLRQQLHEEEENSKRTTAALRKQLKEGEEEKVKAVALLRNQLQETSDKQELDTFNRQHIASLREQLQEQENSSKRAITALRKQLEEVEDSKREIASSFRQQMEEQEEAQAKATATLKQQLQEEADIHNQTVATLKQQLHESTSKHNQDVFNRQIIASLRLQQQEEEATSKRTITSLRLQLQDQEETSSVSITALKQQLREEEQNNRQTITALRQQLSQMTVRVGEEEHKTLSIQREHEERVKELEEAAEEARVRIAELEGEVGKLRTTVDDHQETIASYQVQVEAKDSMLADQEKAREEAEEALGEEVERLSKRLEEERTKVTEGQSREQERMKNLQKHEGEIQKIIDDLNDEVADKTNRLGEYEQMVASYQVQLRHKERQLEQKEVTGQQTTDTLQQKLDSLSQLLEEEHEKLVHVQELLQDTEASNQQTAARLKQQLLDSQQALDAEKQRQSAVQGQLQRRVRDVVEREEGTKTTLAERTQKLKEQEQMFATYQSQVQTQKKQWEASEAAKQQTIATLSSEVVRLNTLVLTEKKRGTFTQSRESELMEQDRVNKLNITDLSEKLRDYDNIIASYQTRERELVQESEDSAAKVREMTNRLAEMSIASPKKEDQLLLEARSPIDASRRGARGRSQDRLDGDLTSRSPSRHHSSSRHQAGTPSGLPNLGNSCYINSVLQCLFSIASLREYFTTDAYKRDLGRSSEWQGQVVTAVAGVVKVMAEGGEGEVRGRLKHLKEVAGVCNEDFRGPNQRNAHDFLSALLSWLHDDTLRPSGSSVITKLFDGERRTVVYCERSGEDISRNTQIFTTLTLTVPPGRSFSLQEVLTNYYRQQSVEWDCKNCRRSHVCRQQTRIRYLPPILIIYLSRPTSARDSQVKRARVTFPSDRFSLQDFMDHRDRSAPTYELFGAVVHEGTVNSGHYTAYCRSYQDQVWRHYDDLQVNPTSLQRVLAQVEVHILFYVMEKK